MPDTLSAIDLRRWAAQCAEKAEDVNRSGYERDRLLRMHASLLALAESADWLAGQPSDPLRALQANPIGALRSAGH